MIRFYHLLLLCYPAYFRERFGDEMELAFAAGLMAARERGVLTSLCYCAGQMSDAILNGLRERIFNSVDPKTREASMFSIFPNELRVAARVLWRQPAYSAVAILLLAVGIGSIVTMFSVVDAVLIRQLPYRNPDRLAFTWTKLGWIGVPRAWMNGSHISMLQTEASTIESFVVLQARDVQLTGLEQPQQVLAGLATTNLCDVLGTPPLLGRTFTVDDGRKGNDHVAVISHSLWVRAFGADRQVLGRSIQLDGQSTQVIGVMPPSFRFQVHSSLGDPREAELWRPGTWTLPAMRNGYGLALLTRIRGDRSLADAQAELDRIGKKLDREQFGNRGFGWQLTGVQSDLVRKTRPTLLILLGAAAVVLLLVCANVAGLILVRAAGRDREFAVRSAIGAGGWRIAMQLMAEALVLASIGAAAGCVLAYLGVEGLRVLPNLAIPRLYDVTVNVRVLSFAIVMALLCAVSFGLAPVLRYSRPELAPALKEGARASGGIHRTRLQAAFVVGQIAFAFVLLVCGALMLRTFVALQRADPGFRPAGVVTARLTLNPGKYPQGRGAPEFLHRVIARIEAIPGTHAAATNSAPLSRSTGQVSATPEGSGPDRELLVDAIRITPGYFAAMGVQVKSGREYSWADTAESEAVVVVDDVFARQSWPGEDPVGKYVRLDKRRRVVAMVRQPHLYEVQREDRPQVYVPFTQSPGFGATLIVRSNDISGAIAAMRAAVSGEDPNQPLAFIRQMDEIVGESLSQRRLSAVLFALFAITALSLASIGVYGVVAFSVSQRTREFGIRMALGAAGTSIRRMVVVHALRLASIGIALGLAGAYGFARLLTAHLYGVSASDALTYGGVVLLLVLVVGWASFLPALRASRLDPSKALRAD